MGDIEACADAEVERFLRKGMWEANRDDCCGVEGGVEAGVEYVVEYGDVSEDEVEGERGDKLSSKVVSAPTCDKLGPGCLCISPKNCSASFMA